MNVSSVTLNTTRRSERVWAARRVQRAVTTLSKAALPAHVSTVAWQVLIGRRLTCGHHMSAQGNAMADIIRRSPHCWCTFMAHCQCAILDTRYLVASARSARKGSTLQAARMPLAHLAPRAGPMQPLAHLTAQVSWVVVWSCDVWHGIWRRGCHEELTCDLTCVCTLDAVVSRAVCDPGWGVEAGVCKQCATGKFSAGGAGAVCTSCPVGGTNTGVGNTHCSGACRAAWKRRLTCGGRLACA